MFDTLIAICTAIQPFSWTEKKTNQQNNNSLTAHVPATPNIGQAQNI